MNIIFPGQLIFSVAVARAGSSFVNYLINRNMVFKRKQAGFSSIVRYYILAALIMLASYVLIRVFNQGLGINLYVSSS